MSPTAATYDRARCRAARRRRDVRLAQQVVFASPEKLGKQYRRLPATSVVAVDPRKWGNGCRPRLSRKITPAAAPFPASDLDAKSPLPGLAEAATKKQVVPRLTGEITRAMLLKNIGAEDRRTVAPARGHRFDRPAAAAVRFPD